jgi:hypothetical protein
MPSEVDMRTAMFLGFLAVVSGCDTHGGVTVADDDGGAPVVDPADPSDSPIDPLTGDPLPDLIITDLRIADASGDGVFAPGENVVVTARLVNPTERDHMMYPGATLTGSIDGVPFEAQPYPFYGIFARTSNEVMFGLELPADGGSHTLEVEVHASVLGSDWVGDGLATEQTLP